MADDRPADGEVDSIAKLRAEFDDFKSTTNARVGRRPVGCIEESLVVRADTLSLNGQLVSRETYPVLWQWAQDNSLVVANLFTAGDGTTTFGLPNFSGRTGFATGTLGTDTYMLGQLFGSARHALAAAEVPNHGHTATAAELAAGTSGSGGDHGHGATGNAGTHDHLGTNSASHTHASDAQHSHSIGTDGGHAGHGGGGTVGVAGGSTYSIVQQSQINLGGHDHGGGSGGAGAHTHGASSHAHSLDPDANHNHTTTTAAAHTHPTAAHNHALTVAATTGGGGTHENRPPGVALHWIIWT